MTERKELLISRHGIKKGNEIIPASIQNLYTTSGAALGEYVRQCGVNPSEVFLRHSDQPRTLVTGNAILAGAFQIPIAFTNEAMVSLEIPGLTDREQMAELSFNAKTLKSNEEAYARDELGYLANWFANPDQTEEEGVPVTSYNEFSKGAEAGLTAPLAHLLNTDKKAGLIVTHAGRVDGLLARIASSGRAKPIERLEEIGGTVPMEGYAILQIDSKPKSGIYEARLVRNGQTYPVNLGNIK